MLVKFKLTMMVVVTSMLSYMIVAGSAFNFGQLFLLTIGGFFVTAASNGLNQVLERDFDILMDRTKNRPVAAKRMKVSEAVLFSGLSLVGGITALALLNPLSALLGMLAFVSYAFIYTPLKRYSTISVAVGAIPGALPVLIGTTAFEGSLTTLGLVLFGIQFLWQFPHFWAIGWLAFEDYKKAGYKLLPINDEGNIDRNVGLHSFVYAMLIFPTIGIGMHMGLELSLITLGVLIIMNGIYAYLSAMFYIKNDRKSAFSLMMSSFFYLPIVLLTFLFN